MLHAGGTQGRGIQHGHTLRRVRDAQAANAGGHDNFIESVVGTMNCRSKNKSKPQPRHLAIDESYTCSLRRY